MASRRRVPTIGLTMGDPCGIGPEVVLKALNAPSIRRIACFAVVGSASIFRKVGGKLGIEISTWPIVGEMPSSRGRGDVFILEATHADPSLAMRGKPTPDGGRASVECVIRGIECAIRREIDALVTAPINKLAVQMAGFQWPGHTELLAEKTGAKRSVMMMVGGGLKVALVTTHASIAAVPSLLTTQSVLETILITSRDMAAYFGLPRPRVAVCGLNPHAGEGGRFGEEESIIIAPAITAARKKGVQCTGPYPADVIFTRAKRGEFDVVVAMYHDQANIPVKLLAFESGVNVTLGLPIIRTSPDHGTAYDIVRRGVAHPGSMMAAIKLAVAMVQARRE